MSVYHVPGTMISAGDALLNWTLSITLIGTVFISIFMVEKMKLEISSLGIRIPILVFLVSEPIFFLIHYSIPALRLENNSIDNF